MAQKKEFQNKTESSDGGHFGISVCDIMRENANDVIEKMESLLPVNMQMYSDFYTEYLHSLQDLFAACYIAENEILSKLGISQQTLQSFGDYTKVLTQFVVTQVEVANNIQKTFLQTQISTIRTYDDHIHLMLDYYSKALAGSLFLLSKKY